MRNYKNHKNNHSVEWSEYHFQWCTKHRYNIFTLQKYKNLCKIILEEACKRHNLNFIDCEVDFNHVHILVSIPLTMTPIDALRYLKGFSSYCLFKLMPLLNHTYRGKHTLWGKGKFIGSVGHITLDKAKEYVDKHYKK